MNENPKYKTSSKLRHTLDIAGECGFDYDTERYPHGGFLNVFQLEKIITQIRELKLQVAGLTKREAKKIEEGHPPKGGH